MWFNYKNLIDFKIYVVKINYWGEKFENYIWMLYILFGML